MTPPLRERLRDVKFTRSAMWGDAELLCHLLAEKLDDLSFRLHRLGGRCYRNAVKAKRRVEVGALARGDELDRLADDAHADGDEDDTRKLLDAASVVRRARRALAATPPGPGAVPIPLNGHDEPSAGES